jgi:hypothetical protein
MKPVFALLFLTAALPRAHAKEIGFQDFKKCFSGKSKAIASGPERSFLRAYVDYLDSGEKSKGAEALSALMVLKPGDGKRISSPWIGLFEGSAKLCCESGGSACAYGMGSATHDRLIPKIKNGDQTAINLVLAYSALVDADGAEGEELASCQAEVRSHKRAVAKFELENRQLLKLYPIQWKD